MSRKYLTDNLPLQGERVILTAVEASDITKLRHFFLDMASLYYYIPTTARPINESQIEALLLDWNDGKENFVFAVRSDNQLIGLVNLDGLDWANSHVEIGIALTSIAARGHGYAFEALSLLIHYCFQELGLHRVWARIIDGNEASIRLFKLLGFQNEGNLRQHVRRNGQFRDMILMSILADEWDIELSQTKKDSSH